MFIVFPLGGAIIGVSDCVLFVLVLGMSLIPSVYYLDVCFSGTFASIILDSEKATVPPRMPLGRFADILYRRAPDSDSKTELIKFLW